MFKLKGAYGEATILQDVEKVEDSCISQIVQLLCSPVVENENVVIMPDCHTGKSSPIGYTQTITNGKVIPNAVSVDIGCRISVCKIPKEIGDKIFNKPGLEKLDKFIRERIPLGMRHRKTEHRFVENLKLDELRCLSKSK